MGRAGLRGPRRGWLVAVVVLALLAVVGWTGATAWRWVAHAPIDAQARVDAVYVLGPVETRIEQARQIMDEGVAPLLLATTSLDQRTGEAYATEHCGEQSAGYRIECVLPDPYTTQGEAQLLAGQVREHGWDRVAVVTSPAHAARARLWMERCVPAEVLVWDYDDGTDRPSPGAVLHQTAGWVMAQVDDDC